MTTRRFIRRFRKGEMNNVAAIDPTKPSDKGDRPQISDPRVYMLMWSGADYCTVRGCLADYEDLFLVTCKHYLCHGRRRSDKRQWSNRVIVAGGCPSYTDVSNSMWYRVLCNTVTVQFRRIPYLNVLNRFLFVYVINRQGLKVKCTHVKTERCLENIPLETIIAPNFTPIPRQTLTLLLIR